ncbi:MAG: 4Fe-4S binding protein [Burkholderiaceae bacterium]|nr:4Fe-4S binding protein [Burkholderiaceae bacterium]
MSIRRALLILAAALGLAGAAHGGVLTRQALQQRYPSPLIVGEKDAQLPVWPVFKQDGTATALVGYLFESIDLAPIPGFSGTPPNLLVALDAKGVFLDVHVLSQHEPVFVDGLGEAPLLRFVEQYKGLSLQQNIRIGSAGHRAERGADAVIDGVAKATASVRIVNQSLLAAALQVARARLGYAGGRDPARLPRVRRGGFEPMDWHALEAAGLVQRLRITRGAAERAFAGSGVEIVLHHAAHDDTFAELIVAHLNVPAVGRNLLDEAGWQRLLGRIDDGDHALLVIASGRYSFVGDDFVRGAVPERLHLRQGALPIELRDLDLDAALKLPPALQRADAKVFRVIGPAGLDLSQPLEVTLRVTREKGIVFPERVSREFVLHDRLPRERWIEPAAAEAAWHGVWRARAWELAVLVAALALLAWLLARPAWLLADAIRLARFRLGFQLFTLAFVGWFAQAQLSMINLTALVQALRDARPLEFLLYDPPTVLLWGFVAVTLLVWGRATFCGWLCPFGALQELVHRLARAVGWRRFQVHSRVDTRLKAIKYAVLAGLLAVALAAPGWSDHAVEIEPFKTAITLGFVRAWPHVLWAGALLLAAAFLYKGFCRYLCPLGAGLALLGRVRLWSWIPRRAECGTPCQTCRHACEYQAIRGDGRIVYDECFQCLECVAIHASERRCAPLIARRRDRVITIRPLPAALRSPGLVE